MERIPMSRRTPSSARGAELVIDKLIPEGKALGRLGDGRVVIAAGAVPGDRIALEVISETKGLVTARTHRLVAPSTLRIPPACELAERCGGCDWMMLSIAEQRKHKLSILREALLRTGKIDWSDRELTLVAGARSEGYRCRVRLQVAAGRIGFHHRGSHELVEPERCAVASDAVNAALTRLRALARRHPRALDAYAWLEVREASDGSVSVLLQRADPPAVVDEPSWLDELSAAFDVAFVGGPASALQRFQLTDETFMLSAPQGFVQVNWEVNRLLVAEVLSGAAQRGVESFVDAYAGSGNFALPLFGRGHKGLAIESNPSAVESAREAASLQGFDPAAFIVDDAAAHAARLATRGERFDLVLVDPPRAGLKNGLAALAGITGGWLAMCSCNPVTLARDLRALLDLGFELESLLAFDMFPQTHHLETLAWLRAPTRTPVSPAVT
jgi:23S rRNA (uracil1939-C5)-methyltransferase